MPSSQQAPQGEAASNFIPCPYKAVLMEPEKELVCIICQTTKLKFDGDDCKGDAIPALLPCGHVFGSECLDEWLQAHNNCPSCRLELKYKWCKHRVFPARLTRSNLFEVPLTMVWDECVLTACRICTGAGGGWKLWEKMLELTGGTGPESESRKEMSAAVMRIAFGKFNKW
ncbi:hypothetical protein QBC47DRAFT_398159 [Echria macrotheca]|uniref:RING-type domain-containing protein n=1 Tax=Echria macrotheca TaxID=438768 RepID=A0AAJ0BLG0_9PEZI|nr:hypothetical protein QBC47DRAFT_398159 [Echria macrotheca]